MNIFAFLFLSLLTATAQQCDCDEGYAGDKCDTFDCNHLKDFTVKTEEHKYNGAWNGTSRRWEGSDYLKSDFYTNKFITGIYRESVALKNWDDTTWETKNIKMLAEQQVDLGIEAARAIFFRKFTNRTLYPVELFDTPKNIVETNLIKKLLSTVTDPALANLAIDGGVTDEIEIDNRDRSNRKIGVLLTITVNVSHIAGTPKSPSFNRSPYKDINYHYMAYDRTPGIRGGPKLVIDVANDQGGCALNEKENLKYGASVELETFLVDKKILNLPAEVIACSGQGTGFDYFTHKCKCKPNQDDATDCRTCKLEESSDGPYKAINWPECDQYKCKEDTCNKQGTCTSVATSFSQWGGDFSTVSSWTESQRYSKAITSGGAGTLCSGKNDNGVMVSWNLDIQQAGRKCCANSVGYCEWDQDCAENRECVPTGYEICESNRKDNQGDPKILACRPDRSCCHGVCCNSDETCEEFMGGGSSLVSWFDPVTETLLDTSAEKLVRMEWMYQTTEVEEDYRYTCTSNNMPVAASLKAWVFPFAVMITIGVSTTIVLKGDSGFDLGNKLITIPALLTIILALFLCFSKMIWSTILLALGSLLAIGAQSSDSKYNYLFSLVFQFMFLAAISNRLGMGTLWVSSGLGTPMDSAFSQSACNTFYNAFKYDGSNTHWDDPGNRYYLHCAQPWLDAVAFFYTMAWCFYFITMVATGTMLMKAGSK